MKIKREQNWQIILLNIRHIILGVTICFVLLGNAQFISNLTLNTQIVIRIVPIILFLISLFEKSISVREALNWFIIIIIALIIYYFSRDGMPLYLILVVFSFRHDELIGVMKIYLISNILIFIIAFILGKIGILATTTTDTISGILKDTVGFRNPNTDGMIIFTIITTMLSIKSRIVKKNNIYKILLFWVLQLFLIYLLVKSGARGAEVGVILSYFIYWLNLVLNNKKLLGYISYIIIAVSLIFSYVSITSSVYTTGSLFYKLNGIFTGRIGLNYLFLNYYGVKVFGQSIHYSTISSSTQVYWYLDNSFIKILINYGFLFFVLFISYYIFIIFLALKKKEYYLLIPLVSFFAYGVVEQALMLYYVNLTALFLGVLYQAEKTSKEKEKYFGK